ncbi:hypothetical protein M9458_004337, partial [Cirrhinus mrigala]
MADPIMDLFDDTPLFNLDSLPEDAFSQGSSDPVEEALKLALGQVDPPTDPTSDAGVPVLSDVVTDPALIPTPVAAPISIPLQTLQTQQPTQMTHDVSMAPASISVQPSLSVASNSSGAATVLLSSSLGVPVSAAQVTTQQLQTQQIAVTQQGAGQGAPKIVILKGPQGQTQVLQGVTGATGSPGKVTLARVLTGTPLRPGMAVVSGGTVLNTTSPGQGQVKVGTGVQRLVQTPNGPMKQVLLTSVPQTQSQVQTQPVQVQIPAQAQLQSHSQPAQVQAQVQVQPQTQVALQAQVQTQDQAPTTTSPGTTAAAVRPQGVTLSAVPQQ